ncbi:MAG: beta-lactamase family protein [Sedimentisphaerales bacterium]|nr:beta-lactamase family protein [Sedimentisphaerales bacterium]
MAKASRFILCWAFIVLTAGVSGCGARETVQPQSVGLSEEGLARITALMQENVEKQRVAGAVAAVARHGKLAYLQCVGKADIEAGRDMQPDTIFRIASMSKPITSVAVLILYDQGKIKLDDPVSKYIPEFKNPMVLLPGQKIDQAAKAKREITIKDLLTHTSGLTYQWDAHLGPLYREAGITHGVISDDGILAEKMKRLARIPLLHEPGEAWTYGLSVDVLGRVIEVASGRSLKQFLDEQVFGPLKMNDSCFFVPDEKLGRLAVAYAPLPGTGLKRLDSEVVTEGPFSYCADHPYKGPKTYYSGGGGLCSTVGDYLRFCQMLLNGGQLDGVRILKESTVAMMTTDQVGQLKQGEGFGLGVSVVRNSDEAGGLDCVGAFGWGGFWYTIFFVDPANDLIAICMSQIHPDGEATLNKKFKSLVYESLAK